MKIKVTSGATAIGVPVLSKTFENILNTIPGVEAEFLTPEKLLQKGNWSDVDVVWNIGFFFDIDLFLDWLKGYYPEIKTVNTWVGTDILNSVQWFTLRSKCYHCALRSIDIHVADGLNLQEELKQRLQLESFYVPSVPDPIPITPLTHDRVAVYLPAHRKDFYNGDAIMEIVKKFPSTEFDFYSITPDPDFPQLPNCHFKGFLSGKEKLDAFTEDAVLITLPEHGSTSLMLIEFMMMGRRVVTNIKTKYAYLVDPVTIQNVIASLTVALNDISKEGVNSEASKYYHEEYGFEKVKSFINPVLEKVKKLG